MTYKCALVSFHWDHISTLTTFNKLVPAVPPRFAHLPTNINPCQVDGRLGYNNNSVEPC